ncbi:hypothetical protein PHYBOEH_005566 [Phytophthora boehmeriae]|uniref:C962R-like N-terminal AEP domain-containing protein n=1 Tax=Phytophthora boehmeriae TaxID=109152 RepID=A0A8T1WJD2_9STRA|nr:hypothetical protein PHYBOEH_005566 [Phytophthora boehmeriae]
MTTNSTSIRSVFESVFDDNKPIKIALHQFMDEFVLSNEDTEATPNFISMAPHYRHRFYVPDNKIPNMMALLTQCLAGEIENHFYELQDMNGVESEDGDLVRVSGLFFEFLFVTIDQNVDFGQVAQSFIRILFTQILVPSLAFDASIATESHYCFYLATTNPQYDSAKLEYNSTFRIVIPTIMLEPETRFFIYRKVWKNAELATLFTTTLNYSLKKSFQLPPRIAPIPLFGSCDIDRIERMQLNKVFKLTLRYGQTTGFQLR